MRGAFICMYVPSSFPPSVSVLSLSIHAIALNDTKEHTSMQLWICMAWHGMEWIDTECV
mgnify:FL=1